MPGGSDKRQQWVLAGLAAAVCVLIFSVALVRSARSQPPNTKYRYFDDLAEASRMPPQQQYSPGPDPGPPPAFVDMGDPRSVDYIVSGISREIEGGLFRWTYLKPVLKFLPQSDENQRFAMDFSINDLTFKDTGPVTLSIYVNDRLLSTLRCAHPGDFHFEQPVPAEWLRGVRPTIVRAELDKVWVAPDGVRLGYVLLRAGFRS